MKSAGDLQAGFKHISDAPDSPAYFVALEGMSEMKRLIGIERPSGDRVLLFIDHVRHALIEEISAQKDRLFGPLSLLFIKRLELELSRHKRSKEVSE